MSDFIKFKIAQAIWVKGLSEERNIFAGFRTDFKYTKGSCALRIAGSSVYRIRLNGKFLSHGPARCGHGVYRIDTIILDNLESNNILTIEVAGYNHNNFAYLDQPSFIQAELKIGDKIIAYTGSNKFKAFQLKERIQRIVRYSFQRQFVEAYRLKSNSLKWLTETKLSKKSLPIEVLHNRKFVDRGLELPKWESKQPVTLISNGSIKINEHAKTHITREHKIKAFKEFSVSEYQVDIQKESNSFITKSINHKPKAYEVNQNYTIKKNQFKIFDFGKNLSGFIGLKIDCKINTHIYLCFDELATEDGDINHNRLGSPAVVKYECQKGEYQLESLESYTFRFLKILVHKGACDISSIFLREYACPTSHKGSFSTSDHKLNDLYEAARETFRQNSVDIFMDCPSRERAGWLCDSFFTARAELSLCGENPIEKNFLENFALATSFPGIKKGMLPMCYPSDHADKNFIPNWAMWFVIELKEYHDRTDDSALVKKLKPRVDGLLRYFEDFLNKDGLLEKLEKWVFLEWSKANNFTQDVNYPSNMLYVGMLVAYHALYKSNKHLKQAESIKNKIIKQSYDGDFFVDNAIRNEKGKLLITQNKSETCQYYAFFFNIATPKTHPILWEKLLHNFGPNRNHKKQYSNIHPSNAFIGFFLRLDILSNNGASEAILDQLYKNYLPMAEKTGTLWEHKDTQASCNHGFASHVAHILNRDILGLTIDLKAKTIVFTIPKLKLNFCEARIPLHNNWIEAKWYKQSKKIAYKISIPDGFSLKVINKSGLPLAK